MKLKKGDIVRRDYKSGKKAYHTVIYVSNLYAFLTKKYHKKPIGVWREVRQWADGELYTRDKKGRHYAFCLPK